MPRSVLALLATLALLLVGSIATTATAIAGGGCHRDVNGNVHNDATTSVVRMDFCSFEPTVARVPVGGEVTFLNTATNEHVVVGRASTWGGDSLRPGDQLAQRFDRAGVFPYTCPLHPGMVGAIVVGEADLVPAAAIVDPGSSTGGAGTGGAGQPEGGGDAWLTGGAGLLIGAGLGLIAAILVRRRHVAGATAV